MTATLERILLVDDDMDTNMIVEHIIKKNKLADHIEITMNGEEALKYLKNNPAPSMILLDINMPKVNGWEFLEQYNKMDPNFRKSIVIVMVTASLNSEDMKRAKQYNIGFTNKPLTADILRNIIDSNGRSSIK